MENKRNNNPCYPTLFNLSDQRTQVTEQINVYDGRIDMGGLPDQVQGVEVKDGSGKLMIEVIEPRELHEGEFRINYVHGWLYVNPAIYNNQTLTLTFYSRGLELTAASRVYLIDEDGRINLSETLQSFIDSAKTEVRFTPSRNVENIRSGELQATIFGKLYTWYDKCISKLKGLAYKDKITLDDTDAELKAKISQPYLKLDSVETTTNLNSLVLPGRYQVSASISSASTRNYPPNEYEGSVDVLKLSDNNIMQTFHPYVIGSNCRLWIRTLSLNSHGDYIPVDTWTNITSLNTFLPSFKFNINENQEITLFSTQDPNGYISFYVIPDNIPSSCPTLCRVDINLLSDSINIFGGNTIDTGLSKIRIRKDSSQKIYINILSGQYSSNDTYRIIPISQNGSFTHVNTSANTLLSIENEQVIGMALSVSPSMSVGTYSNGILKRIDLSGSSIIPPESGTSYLGEEYAPWTEVFGKNIHYKTSSSQNGDYSETWEWIDGNPDAEDRVGYFVAMQGTKIRFATASDPKSKIGVVSAVPCIVADAAPFYWHKKYQTDIYGRELTKIVHHEEQLDENGNIIQEAYDSEELILNPDFDASKIYVPRLQRDEYTAIGDHGKLVVIDDGSCVEDGFCYPNDNGIATNSEDGYYVMERLDDSHIRIYIK